MKAWWLKRTPRERLMVAGGGVFLAVLASLQLVLSPVMAWRADAERRAETAEGEYRLVYRSAALAIPEQRATQDDTPVRNVVSDSATRSEVSLTFVNVLADGSVEIQGGPARPENVIRFFSALETEHGVRVVAADIVRVSDEPKNVRLQATVAR